MSSIVAKAINYNLEQQGLEPIPAHGLPAEYRKSSEERIASQNDLRAAMSAKTARRAVAWTAAEEDDMSPLI